MRVPDQKENIALKNWQFVANTVPKQLGIEAIYSESFNLWRKLKDVDIFFRLSQTANKSLKLADLDSPSKISAIEAADIPILLASVI